MWPGGGITYSIWVWSTAPAHAVTATASIRGRAAGSPKFTLCPAGHQQTCSVGDLSPNQAIELFVTSHVGTAAVVGDQVTLTVTVQGAGLSPAVAAITAVIGVATPSPTASGTTSPPFTAPQIPPVVLGPAVNPGSLNTLFPVVTPGPTPSNPATKKGNRVTTATSTASTLPLDPRLIGGQLAGLAILAAAVTLAVARLSLRSATPASPSAPSSPSGEVAPGAEDPADET